MSRQDDRELVATAGSQARRAAFGPGGSAAMPVERSDDLAGTLRRLVTLLGTETRRLVVVALLTLVSVVLVVLGPWLLGRATDIIVDGVSGSGIEFGALARTLGVVVALYLGSWVLGAIQGYVLAGVVQRSMYALREQVEDHIHRLPLSYVDGQSRGDLLSRVTNDIDNLSQSLQQTTGQILTAFLTLIGVAVMMFTISPLMAVIGLITVPASVWLIAFIGGRARPRFLAQWRHTGSLNAQVEEVVTGHAIVKSFGRQFEVEAEFRDDNDRLHDASLGAQFMASLIQPAMMFMGNIQLVLIAVVGGLRISSGAISIGDMQALIQYSRQFAQPLTHLASMAATFQSGLASLERVLEFLDAEPEIDADLDDSTSTSTASTASSASSASTDSIVVGHGAPVVGDAAPVVGRVVFDDVRFSYHPSEPLIEHLDLEVEPGRTVAIVGPTGAGKTTLVNLLMRFYELDGGRITLDGRDISSIPRRQLRAAFGMVLQDTWMFGGTIRENIAYGDPDATEDRLLEAARVTYVDRFVHALPGGYETVIDDEGTNLSAGEKQLITIARAFLSDPSILILDEATSSVDTRTEVLIQEAMNVLRHGRTSFVIAHRLSTIRGADMILVMDGGRIVEQGHHDELMSVDGAYARLHRAQFAGQST